MTENNKKLYCVSGPASVDLWVEVEAESPEEAEIIAHKMYEHELLVTKIREWESYVDEG